ncbi:MAG: flagellar biosynthesis anti-sigma factor FlgM [Aquabacterium sp.]
MKIGNPLDKSVGGVGPRTEGASSTTSSGKTSSTTSSTSESAKVTLSTVASGLMSVEGEFDAEKVSSVKQAIDNGTYQVNPEVIADKLITNARDLLQARQG